MVGGYRLIVVHGNYVQVEERDTGQFRRRTRGLRHSDHRSTKGGPRRLNRPTRLPRTVLFPFPITGNEPTLLSSDLSRNADQSTIRT
jgi:hypothetical protein